MLIVFFVLFALAESKKIGVWKKGFLLDDDDDDVVKIGDMCFGFFDDDDYVASSVRIMSLYDDTDDVQLEQLSPFYALDMIKFNAFNESVGFYTGQGVEIFVFDTGLTVNHEEFRENRASAPMDAIMTGESSQEDIHGHGTHVSGCAAGSLHGSAPGAHVVSVKVMTNSGGGSVSNIVRGIAWVFENAKQKGIVINMSLSTSTNGALNAAVDAATAAGAMVVVAAGNQGGLASDRSPASAETAITVGAVGSTGLQTSWSNSGPAVNVWAPGYKVSAARARTESDIQTKSGTSMSSPLVAGAAAAYLEKHGYDPILARNDLLSNVQDGNVPIIRLPIVVVGETTKCTNLTVTDNTLTSSLPMHIRTFNSSITGHNFLVRFEENNVRIRSRRKADRRKMVYTRRMRNTPRFRAVLKYNVSDYDFTINTNSVLVNNEEIDSGFSLSENANLISTIIVTHGVVEVCY